MGRESLGDFEQLVLLAVVRLRDDAYGMGVRREITERTGREVSIGAVYATAERLVEKGLLRAIDRRSQGDRARRFFEVTRLGTERLAATRDEQNRMWTGVRLPRTGGGER